MLMNAVNSWLAQFCATWNIFVRWKLPVSTADGSFEQIDNKPALARIMMPLAGAFMGLCLYLPCWGISVIFGHIAAGISAAVAAPLLIEFATDWRGISALSTYLQLRRAGASHEEAFLAKPESMTEPRPPASMLLLITIYVLRIVLFGVLANVYCPFWFIVTLTGGYLVRMHLCGMNEPGRFGEHFYPLPDESMQKYGWYVGLAVMLIAGMFHIPSVLLAFAFAGGLAWLAKQLCLDSISGINRQAVEVFGYVAEIILLFLGVLLFTGPT